MSDLNPCPHCGKTETLEFATRRENEDCPNFDDCDAEECKYGACDYFGNWDCVVCSAIKSGCGATGGYASCPAEAVEKWNTRAERTCHMEQIPECRYDDIECDECGVALWAFSMDMRGEGIYATPNYCPYCGARVKGEHDG